MLIGGVAVVVVCVFVLVFLRMKASRETFDLGGIWDKIKSGASVAGNAVKGVAVKVKNKVSPSKSQQAPPPPPPPPPPRASVPTYVSRQMSGSDAFCPDNTVDTGLDDPRACISSQFHPANVDGKCPLSTTDTGDNSDPGKKCEVGYVSRVSSAGQWVCPEGTVDTGNSWDKGWREGQKQCRRVKAYTAKYIGNDGTAVCPEGSRDTGRLCKWVGNVA